MSPFDWILVLVLNGSIIGYGLYLSRDVKTSSDWFLAGRRLPWWLVGVSMYATVIDSSDLVADSGWTYSSGFRVFVMNWVGISGGWILAAFFIVLPMYRVGMYTNAEYLEARFGVAARVIGALVQVQYRTSILATISMTMYLTLKIVCDWGEAAWLAVAVISILATIYTALGGLRSVAVTDALQFCVMSVAALILWTVVWQTVGGFDGIREKLAAHDKELPNQLLHVGHDHLETEDVQDATEDTIARKQLLGGEFFPAEGRITRRTPAWIYIIAMLILGSAYSVVNQTQSMRMFGARSEWDLKMCASVAGIALIVMSFFNLSMGVMGRALYPDPMMIPGNDHDGVYPHLVTQLSIWGLKGVVVAGILAASFSTYDSIGSALSSLLTRDVYARLIVRSRSDKHYLRVGQWLTPVIIGISFLYIPFLQGEKGMVLVLVSLISAFVVPLFTLYLMGTFTRVHRASGTIGLLVGSLYGIVRLGAVPLAEKYGVVVLPPFLTNPYGAYLYSLLVTAGTMLIVSLFLGWEPKGMLLQPEREGWLRNSQLELQKLNHEPSVPRGTVSRLLPAVLAGLVLLIGLVLSFIVFW
jgi:SSS family solute:Na+ symporter